MQLSNIKIYLLTQFIVASSYYLVKLLTPFAPIELPLTEIDTFFKPHFLAPWVYMSFFFMIICGMIFSTREEAIKCSKIIIINSVIASVFFILLPTKITYTDYLPYIDSNAISYDFMMIIKKYDDTYNCFPSLHIANSIIATAFLIKGKKTYAKVLSLIWLVSIFWSVISTKQHTVYDIVGGGIVALISYNFFFHFIEKKKNIKESPSY